MGSLAEVPFLVVDIETTGLDPERAGVVEIACVVVHGETRPRPAFETLVDPGHAIPNSDIHGITDADVDGAPRFAELRAALRGLMANRVLVAHNAAFERRHLEARWGDAGELFHAPWLCTMRLPSQLGFGSGRMPLWWASQRAGFEHPEGQRHHAASDAMATARVLRHYLERMASDGITTLDGLADRLKRSKHREAAEMLRRRPLRAPEMLIAPTNVASKPRAAPTSGPRSAAQTYLEATVAVLEDLVVDDDEIARLDRLRGELKLGRPTVERVYDRIWQGAMQRYEEDGHIDDDEARHIEALRRGFERLSWQPPAR